MEGHCIIMHLKIAQSGKIKHFPMNYISNIYNKIPHWINIKPVDTEKKF